MIPCFIGIGRPAPDAVITKQIDLNFDQLIHWQKFESGMNSVMQFFFIKTAQVFRAFFPDFSIKIKQGLIGFRL